MSSNKFRTEHDSMGELQVPADALWGATTQRAVENFPISGLPMPPRFISAMGLVKWACAGANAELGLIKSDVAIAIQKAAGCRIGQDYPKPIVDHKEASTRNKSRIAAAYERHKANAGGGGAGKRASGAGEGKAPKPKKQAKIKVA